MSVIPAWAAKFVGLPYKDKGRGPDGWDCWGGVRYVLAEQFGIDLPSYADAYATGNDHGAVAAAVDAGLRTGWRGVTEPQAGDLLILSIAGRPWHCAVMVNPRMFLHWPPPDAHGVQQLSCIERIDAPKWMRRIEGFYRHE